MDQTEFETIQATFPWTERILNINGMGGLIQVIDRNGNEVPILTMTKFLQMITRRLEQKQQPQG